MTEENKTNFMDNNICGPYAYFNKVKVFIGEHPGSILMKASIENNIKTSSLAESLNMTTEDLIAFTEGKRNVDFEFACKLEQVITPFWSTGTILFWLNQQKEYDKEHPPIGEYKAPFADLLVELRKKMDERGCMPGYDPLMLYCFDVEYTKPIYYKNLKEKHDIFNKLLCRFFSTCREFDEILTYFLTINRRFMKSRNYGKLFNLRSNLKIIIDEIGSNEALCRSLGFPSTKCFKNYMSGKYITPNKSY